jgi:hypothetical protein
MAPPGRRFPLCAGDLFGWDALKEYDFGVEAVTSVKLRRYPCRSLEALADRDQAFTHRLRALTATPAGVGSRRIDLKCDHKIRRRSHVLSLTVPL